MFNVNNALIMKILERNANEVSIVFWDRDCGWNFNANVAIWVTLITIEVMAFSCFDYVRVAISLYFSQNCPEVFTKRLDKEGKRGKSLYNFSNSSEESIL